MKLLAGVARRHYRFRYVGNLRAGRRTLTSEPRYIIQFTGSTQAYRSGNTKMPLGQFLSAIF